MSPPAGGSCNKCEAFMSSIKKTIKRTNNYLHMKYPCSRTAQIRMTEKQHAHQLQQFVHNILWVFHMTTENQIIHI